jgi:hypothetical protein
MVLLLVVLELDVQAVFDAHLGGRKGGREGSIFTQLLEGLSWQAHTST